MLCVAAVQLLCAFSSTNIKMPLNHAVGLFWTIHNIYVFFMVCGSNLHKNYDFTVMSFFSISLSWSESLMQKEAGDKEAEVFCSKYWRGETVAWCCANKSGESLGQIMMKNDLIWRSLIHQRAWCLYPLFSPLTFVCVCLLLRKVCAFLSKDLCFKKVTLEGLIIFCFFMFHRDSLK